jgi:sialate O-acetylesterase
MRIPGIEAEANPNDWQAKVELRFPDLTPESKAALPKVPSAQPQSTASCLFNGQIRPLIPFAIRGSIWYQGESSVDRSKWYATTLTTLIGDWRQRWGEGDFPFYIVQLANLGRPPIEPEESDWAEVREAQLQVSKKVPNTGLAVAIDIGEENDIHPRNKRATGNQCRIIRAGVPVDADRGGKDPDKVLIAHRRACRKGRRVETIRDRRCGQEVLVGHCEDRG